MVLQVTYATFGDLHAQCESARSALENAITEMNATVNGALAENWQGDGQQAYFAAQHKWNTAANDLYEVLKQVEASLDGCGQTYQAMENQVVAMF